MPRRLKEYTDKNPTKGEGVIVHTSEREESSRLKPSEIVKQWFQHPFSSYTVEQKRELIDYLSEWFMSKSFLSNLNSLKSLTLVLEQKFSRDFVSGRSFERYLYSLADKTTTQENFMNYLLGEDNFAKLKEKMQSRPEDYRESKKYDLEEHITR